MKTHKQTKRKKQTQKIKSQME